MLPGNGIGDTDKSCYPGSPEYKFKYGSEGLNTSDIKEYIRNPHKFNTRYYMDGQYYNLWSTDNDRTDNNNEVVIKSVYDPSPVGYSLPASNAFTGFTTTGENVGDWDTPATPEQKAKFNVKGNWDKGWYFYTKPNKKGSTVFFPTCGYRIYNTAKIGLISIYGLYWSGSPHSSSGGRHLLFSSLYVTVIYGSLNSYGFSVRSAEEK